MDSGYYMSESVYNATDSAEMVAVGMILIILLIYLVIMGIGLASYIMNALALYKIADRRKISNPWMAWLPFTSDWLIGSIVDDYDGRNGIKRKWRVLLLTLSLASVIGVVVAYIGMFVGMFSMMLQYGETEPPVGSMLAFIGIVYIVLIVFAILATAKSFCQVICVYKIFESTVPKKAVKYILLYLLVPLAGPICLLRCKDKGYPYPEQQEFVSYEVPEIPDVIDTPEKETEEIY